MRVTLERLPKVFVPVNIQLETQEELDKLNKLIADTRYEGRTGSFLSLLYEALCKESMK